MNSKVHDRDETHAQRTRQRAHWARHPVVGPESIGISIIGKCEKLSDCRKTISFKCHHICTAGSNRTRNLTLREELYLESNVQERSVHEITYREESYSKTYVQGRIVLRFIRAGTIRTVKDKWRE